MKKYSSRKIKQSVFIALMLTPAIVGFFIFYIYVNFKSVFMAFSFEKGGETFYGLDNFVRFFKHTGYLLSVREICTLINE